MSDTLSVTSGTGMHPFYDAVAAILQMEALPPDPNGDAAQRALDGFTFAASREEPMDNSPMGQAMADAAAIGDGIRRQ
jgi:hypothetical protein